jgi:drug/metabolite transporter (DMT)-like permease
VAQAQERVPGGYTVPDTGVQLLNPALFGGIAVGILTVMILFAAFRFDRSTHGFLTISILIVMGFVLSCFGAMIYSIPTNPATEILVGAMATALGAVVSQWIGRMKLHPVEPVEEDEETIDHNSNRHISGGGAADDHPPPPT